ncbi:MAG: phospho-N-acetylmuramoyl-pentapeptide-transferase, partial [Pyrinomonadaceae bacterium]
MLYYFLYKLVYQANCANGCESVLYKGLNVFQYVTFRTALAAIIALVVSLLTGDRVIKKLAALKFGQEIRAEGPESHQAKKGTPTMGGVLIIGSVFVSTLLCARLDSLYLWIALVATTLFAAVGFGDDYIKFVKKRSLGLTGKQKLLGQLITAIGVWGALFWFSKYTW